MQLMGAAALWIQVIQETAGLTEKLALKWPNDLLCGDRKLGGFLGETRDSTVLLGMGINVNNPVSDLEGTFRYPPVSLRDVTGRHFSRRRLLLAWWRHWRGGAEATNHGGLFDPADLEQKLTTLGKRVSVKDAEGRAVSLAPDGGLRLEVGGEVRTVYAGEAVETRVS